MWDILNKINIYFGKRKTDQCFCSLKIKDGLQQLLDLIKYKEYVL